MEYLIGIDCGKGGAICVRHTYEAGEEFIFFDTPVVKGKAKGEKTQYDERAMARILYDVKHESDDIIVVLEKQQPMPLLSHQRGGNEDAKMFASMSSVFTTGYGYGLWKGLLVALSIPVEIVAPVTWKKKMLADQPKSKEASRLRALQLFPQCADSLKFKKNEARAEALLMTEFFRRYRLNECDLPIGNVSPSP